MECSGIAKVVLCIIVCYDFIVIFTFYHRERGGEKDDNVEKKRCGCIGK